MPAQRLLQIILVIFLLIPACTPTEDKQQAPQLIGIPQIEEIKPEKPVKIKLKRNAKDDYSWEISGDNIDEIIKTDQKLRKTLKSN